MNERHDTEALLLGLTAGDWGPSWSRLEQAIGWSGHHHPLFAPTVARLTELLPELAPRHRVLVLEFLALRARSIGNQPPVPRQAGLAVFADNLWRLVPLLADPEPVVRGHAAWALREVPVGDPEVVEALRRQAVAETDPRVLSSCLFAVGAQGAAGDTVAAGPWLRPWLAHTEPCVRLAAALAMLTPAVTDHATADDAVREDLRGVGRVAGRVLTGWGIGGVPAEPWWPREWRLFETLETGLVDHPDEAAALVAELARHSGPALRGLSVRVAGAQLHHWRDPGEDWWKRVLAGLDDEDTVVDSALKVLSRAGTGIAPYADELVRHQKRICPPSLWPGAFPAVAALVRLGDDRALDRYRDGVIDGFHQALPPPERWAPHLLPAFRASLAEGPDSRCITPVLQALTRWGPAAAPAVPELIRLLDTPRAREAAEALGRIGPAAGRAAGLLARLGRGDVRPPRHGSGLVHGGHPWHGRQTAAWAHWRITGDPALALRVVGTAARQGPSRPVLRYLADLGPLAAPYAVAVRPLLTGVGEWTRVGAAEAWWRITGDAATAVDVLLPELRGFTGHRLPPVSLRAVEALGRIGRPAAAAVPVLRVLVDSGRRYGDDAVRDEELRHAAAEALTRIGSDPGGIIRSRSAGRSPGWPRRRAGPGRSGGGRS
ncbi:HEAT repeat domain-containing protein [Streptomyces sp. NPDC048603]|uniref:HEAT repeat domain-containing protein n=1 Tax=Streptomyces sp. NPDC048603 TaxID=3365577 RepID=UPI003717E384